jgi:hypothetical protein
MDRFFTQEKCDRCYADLKNGRTMSWFTEQTICMDCSSKESEIRKRLSNNGRDYEGCGWIPTPPEDKKAK